MTAHRRYVENVVTKIRKGEWMIAWGLGALQAGGCNPDACAIINALDWLAAVEMYSQPDHDDGDTPFLGDRQEINRLRRAEAERQFEACMDRLARVEQVAA